MLRTRCHHHPRPTRVTSMIRMMGEKKPPAPPPKAPPPPPPREERGRFDESRKSDGNFVKDTLPPPPPREKK